jgi:hypothetical protein
MKKQHKFWVVLGVVFVVIHFIAKTMNDVAKEVLKGK